MEVELWTFREPVPNVDLTGFKVEATDGSIGKIDEATYDTGNSYIVVDTGPWIFGKKVMLPAWTISGVDLENERVFVDRIKDEIKNAPEFDPDQYQEPIYREKLGSYYADYNKR
jgi:hypothetical protein